MSAPIVLSRDEFNALPEYSCSLPSGTIVGKRWRANRHSGTLYGWGPARRCPAHPNWWMGEYYDIGSETRIGIRWTRIVLADEALVQSVINAVAAVFS